MWSLTHIRGLLGKCGFDKGKEGRVNLCVVRLELVRRQIEKSSVDATVRFVASVAAAAGHGVACLGVTVGKGRRQGTEWVSDCEEKDK